MEIFLFLKSIYFDSIFLFFFFLETVIYTFETHCCFSWLRGATRGAGWSAYDSGWRTGWRTGWWRTGWRRTGWWRTGWWRAAWRTARAITRHISGVFFFCTKEEIELNRFRINGYRIRELLEEQEKRWINFIPILFRRGKSERLI